MFKDHSFKTWLLYLKKAEWLHIVIVVKNSESWGDLRQRHFWVFPGIDSLRFSECHQISCEPLQVSNLPTKCKKQMHFQKKNKILTVVRGFFCSFELWSEAPNPLRRLGGPRTLHASRQRQFPRRFPFSNDVFAIPRIQTNVRFGRKMYIDAKVIYSTYDLYDLVDK